MILNYRVELCRRCYFKRTSKCFYSDKYINNDISYQVASGGECHHYIPIPWLP